MQAHIRCILPCLLVENGMHRPFAAIGHFACRNLFISGIILAISLSMSSLAPAAGRVSARSAENTDTRWLPWIGSWRLMPEVVKENDRSSKENYLVEIRSGDDGKSIIMKSFQDEKLLLETKIAADGSSQPLENNKCSGWYKYSWSDTGKRLLFESESGCPAELPRFISGISIITDNRDWLDIQLLQSGEDHAVSIRKYRSISENISTATKIGPSPTEAPRYLAGTSLSIDEVIELSRKVPSELLEAAILELQKPFKINSSTLKRLSSAGVQPQVVDLMVALSFPDKFTVNLQRIAPVRQTHSAPAGAFYSPSYIWLPFGFWSIYGPYSNWYWGTPVYGYWGSGWDSWPRGYSGGHGGRGDDGGGRLINGRGYSRVEPGNPNSQPRYAHPRDNSNSSSGGGNQGSTSPSSPPPATSSGSSSQSSTGRSGSSGGSPPSASPSGYHSGGGEGGGRQAKPRD
jgi:hypothetical protein